MDNKNIGKIVDHLEVMQICDSTFPIGTFNHSFGMENYLRNQKINGAAEFEVWLKNYYLSQFKYGEGLLTLLTYHAVENDNYQEILKMDNLITRSTAARETRNAAKLIANQMIILVEKLYGDKVPFLKKYQEDIKEGKAFGNPAIAFTMLAHYKDISITESYFMYGYSVASTLVQNAVRAVPLGQREGQVVLNKIIKLLGKLFKEEKNLDVSYLGANSPGLEMAQINHEAQPTRLFMS